MILLTLYHGKGKAVAATGTDESWIPNILTGYVLLVLPVVSKLAQMNISIFNFEKDEAQIIDQQWK